MKEGVISEIYEVINRTADAYNDTAALSPASHSASYHSRFLKSLIQNDRQKEQEKYKRVMASVNHRSKGDIAVHSNDSVYILILRFIQLRIQVDRPRIRLVTSNRTCILSHQCHRHRATTQTCNTPCLVVSLRLPNCPHRRRQRLRPHPRPTHRHILILVRSSTARLLRPSRLCAGPRTATACLGSQRHTLNTRRSRSRTKTRCIGGTCLTTLGLVRILRRRTPGDIKILARATAEPLAWVRRVTAACRTVTLIILTTATKVTNTATP